jgi:hypothetical protein
MKVYSHQQKFLHVSRKVTWSVMPRGRSTVLGGRAEGCIVIRHATASTEVPNTPSTVNRKPYTLNRRPLALDLRPSAAKHGRTAREVPCDD